MMLPMVEYHYYGTILTTILSVYFNTAGCLFPAAADFPRSRLFSVGYSSCRKPWLLSLLRQGSHSSHADHSLHGMGRRTSSVRPGCSISEAEKSRLFLFCRAQGGEEEKCFCKANHPCLRSPSELRHSCMAEILYCADSRLFRSSSAAWNFLLHLSGHLIPD